MKDVPHCESGGLSRAEGKLSLEGEEVIDMSNNNATLAAAGSEQKRKPNRRNADNHDLWCWESLPVGDVPEVNGLWAQEMREFVPTFAELLTIAEHWADDAIERTFVEWANATNIDDWRRIYFAWRRVYRVRTLIGDVVDSDPNLTKNSRPEPPLRPRILHPKSATPRHYIRSKGSTLQ